MYRALRLLTLALFVRAVNADSFDASIFLQAPGVDADCSNPVHTPTVTVALFGTPDGGSGCTIDATWHDPDLDWAYGGSLSAHLLGYSRSVPGELDLQVDATVPIWNGAIVPHIYLVVFGELTQAFRAPAGSAYGELQMLVNGEAISDDSMCAFRGIWGGACGLMQLPVVNRELSVGLSISQTLGCWSGDPCAVPQSNVFTIGPVTFFDSKGRVVVPEPATIWCLLAVIAGVAFWKESRCATGSAS